MEKRYRYRLRGLACILFATFLTLGASAQDEDPFAVSASVRTGTSVLEVRLRAEEGHFLYEKEFRVTAGDAMRLALLEGPRAIQKKDPVTGQPTGVYVGENVLRYKIVGWDSGPLVVAVSYQGCNDTLCFMPQTERFAFSAKGVLVDPTVRDAAVPDAPDEKGEALDRFTITGRAAGYLNKEDFLAFLDRVEAGAGLEQDALAAFRQRGIWFSIALILVGGLLLNLTPCVLPMIPINIAIIGAGAAAGSRGRGFRLGATYGLGISLVYGALGVAVVLTGATFGTLNASPWFNLGIAVVFVALALAMFDVFSIDLSRFQTGMGSGQRRGGYITALLFGGIAALLAGACVAPVVLSVLLLSAKLYAGGAVAGLLLPFLLGLGMALPWPFAGAGLSFLPKPGKWMQWVRNGFGVLILLFAAYYGTLAVSILRNRSESSRTEVAAAQEERVKDGWHTSLDQALLAAEGENKPVFVDFWASWCKNCLHMEKTTFKDPEVQRRLDGYVRVKVRAEDPSEPVTKALLSRMGVKGLPTYVALRKGAPDNEREDR